MSDQPTLDDALRLARTTDPQTSHDAAERVLPKIGTVRAQVLWCFFQHGDLTDQELMDRFREREQVWLKWKRASDSSIRTRRSELVRQGWLRDSGRTRLSVAGLKMTVWEMAP